jgi:hypothetical protein
MENVTLIELLKPFSATVRAAFYRKVKASPNALGTLFCETLDLGMRHEQSLLLYGPGMTFETWHAAEGKAIQGASTTLTNPLYAQKWACIPETFRTIPGMIDEFIHMEEKKAVDELPHLWMGRKKGHGIRMSDIFVNPNTELSMKVLTFSDRGDSFLVCPTEWYSEDAEHDPNSPNFGYRKHHDKWSWMSMTTLYEAGYTNLTDKLGTLYAILVPRKDQEKGIA